MNWKFRNFFVVEFRLDVEVVLVTSSVTDCTVTENRFLHTLYEEYLKSRSFVFKKTSRQKEAIGYLISIRKDNRKIKPTVLGVSILHHEDNVFTRMGPKHHVSDKGGK